MSPWWWWLWSWWWLWWWYRLVQHSLELSTRWWYRLVHLQHSLELSTRWQCWCWYDNIDLEITNDDSVTKVLIFIMLIDWSAVQATSFVPFPRMQCILVQVNSHAATSVWVLDVRHWILALPRCAISWILFAGVWAWHTQFFFGEPILPLCRAFFCKCFPMQKPVCMSMWVCDVRWCIFAQPFVLSRSTSSSLQACECVWLQSTFSCILPSAAAAVISLSKAYLLLNSQFWRFIACSVFCSVVQCSEVFAVHH